MGPESDDGRELHQSSKAAELDSPIMVGILPTVTKSKSMESLGAL